jgi:hypothetical protein
MSRTCRHISEAAHANARREAEAQVLPAASGI